MALQFEGLGQGLDDAAGQAGGAGEVGQAALDHRELVAAQARDGVALAHAGPQALGGGLQQGVADRMAQGVVDGLEAIQVDAVHRHQVLAPRRAAQRRRQVLLEQQPVGKIRQRIIVGQTGDLGLGPLALGDVFRDPQQVLGRAVRAGNGDLLGAQQGQRAVLARHVVLLDHPHLARRDHLGVALAIDRRLLRRIEVGVGAADHVGAGVAQDLLAGPIEQHVGMVVGPFDEHHRRDGLDHRGHEGVGLVGAGLGRGQIRDAPAVGLVGGLQQAQHRTHAQIASAVGDDEAAQQVAGSVRQAVAGEGGQLDVGLDHQRVVVHQHRDRAQGVERAAVLGGHAQEEGVALDQADRPVVGVQHRHDQRVGLFAEPFIQGLAQGVGAGRNQGRNGVSQGEHRYASTRGWRDHFSANDWLISGRKRCYFTKTSWRCHSVCGGVYRDFRSSSGRPLRHDAAHDGGGVSRRANPPCPPAARE
jgi:hypothetical protein